jgi:hypothetical protein
MVSLVGFGRMTDDDNSKIAKIIENKIFNPTPLLPALIIFRYPAI